MRARRLMAWPPAQLRAAPSPGFPVLWSARRLSRLRPFTLLGVHNLELTLNPGTGLIRGYLMRRTNVLLLCPALIDAEPGARKDHVEVHTIDTHGRVVLDPEINVFRDAEPEVSSGGEARVGQFKVLDAEAALDDLAGLFAANGDVCGDLLTAADPEAADGEARLGERRLLVGELLEDLSSLCQRVALSSDADVEDELLNADTPHGVLTLLGHLGGIFFQLMNFNLNY